MKHIISDRRMVVRLTIALLLIVAGLIAAYVIFLGPGEQNTDSDLATPTITAVSRVFEVSVEELQVDFTTQVNGVDVAGVFPVTGGRITLEPIGSELRVLVDLEINVDGVSTGSIPVDFALRTAMKTRGSGETYPMSFYAATSASLVPVTEEEIYFELDGNLQLHDVVHNHPMSVDAQLVGHHMWAVARSDLDLANHGIELPPPIQSSTIKLTARLQAYETDSLGAATDEPSQ